MPAAVMLDRRQPWRPITVTRDEAEWMAERDLRHAVRYRGADSPQAKDKARSLCAVFGVDPDRIVRRIWPAPDFRVIAFGVMPEGMPPSPPPPIDVRAWQDVIRMAVR